MIKIILFLITILSLTSCIELLDDITIHSDGTGTFKYLINLSQSKTKVNSILALDTLNGEKVPDIYEIEQKIVWFKTELSKQPGIKNVSVSYNFTDYIFKLNVDFESVTCLQNAVVNTFQKITENTFMSNKNWLIWNDNCLSTDLSEIVNKWFSNSNLLDKNLIVDGTYTTISRFDRPVISFTNSYSKLSKNGLAIMTKVGIIDLLSDRQVLKNIILIEGDY